MPGYCGWCVNRDVDSGRTDGIVYPPHKPCGFRGCACRCTYILKSEIPVEIPMVSTLLDRLLK
jgi:hypothetical protein